MALIRRAALFAFLLIFPALLTAQDSTLEQARQARFAGRIDEAERLLILTLRRDPTNYIALYNMGLVYEARAVRAPAGEPRLRHFRMAAAWLERAYRSPGRRMADLREPRNLRICRSI